MQVPVVKEYHASDENKTRTPGANVLTDATRPFVQDVTTVIPDPFRSTFFRTRLDCMPFVSPNLLIVLVCCLVSGAV